MNTADELCSSYQSYDYLIIGAGPAGLQLGYFLRRAGRHFLILDEADHPGSFYDVLPRHGQMISINKLYTGYEDPETRLRYDWNSLLCDDPQLLMRHYSTRYFPQNTEYLHYLKDFAQRYELPIRYSARVTRVTRHSETFALDDQGGNHYYGKRLIIATGMGRTPNYPTLSGIDLAVHYLHCSLDPAEYADQRVLIIGKGNAAFETANSLAATARIIHMCSPHSVKLAWETHFMGHVRTVNTEFIDTYYLKGQNGLLDARVERLERKPDGIVASLIYSHADGQTMQLVYDRVILCTGFRFDDSIFDESCRPELFFNGKLPAMTHEWKSTNVKDLYFAGTLMQMRDFQKTMSSVTHGFRFNISFLSQLLAQKYHGQSLPYRELALDADILAQQILKRVSTAAALFLQPDFLGDLLVVDRQAQYARYYENISLDYVRSLEHAADEEYYTISLAYGPHTENPRHPVRDPNPNLAYKDIYLHPVIRHYRGASLLNEQHLAENLENNWQPERFMLLRTTQVPGKFTEHDMLNYAQRLQDFLRRS